MNLQRLRRECRALLELSRTARPIYCADVIISRRLGIERAELLYKDDDIPPQKCGGIFSLIARRAKGVPLSYVLHEAEFYGYVFKVGRGVLIPRPETELLVESALEYYPPGLSARFADWCTGSACIAISLLLENTSLRGIGIDKSRQALRWAAINVKHHSHALGGRLSLLRNENPEEAPFSDASFDFIISNPPYIPEDELSGLMCEVADYEPRVALDGGAGGLCLYRKFFTVFPRMLKRGGMLFLETAGAAQIAELERILPKEFSVTKKIIDYNGIPRHVILRRN